MTHELIYTSAPKGLKPGSRGFSTVAQTRHTPGVLAESLEALSGYKFAFPMGSSQERLNPVAYSHFILSSGGIAHHVLSRVSAAPPDYTGRSNKLAHHLVLTPAEAAQLPGGPAALMEQPDFFKTSWSGDPHWIEAPRSLKACEATTSVCSQWKKTTGDAGWAGKLAEEWQSNSSSPLILVFPEGLDVLPLVEESLSLLPPADRWRLTFSTYFTSLPAGVRECSLRCILAGSEEHQKSLAQVGSRIVDLSKPLPSLETSSLIDDARNGTRLTKPNPIPQIPKTSKPQAIKPVPTNGPLPPVRIEVVENPTWEPPDTSDTPLRKKAHTPTRPISWAVPLIAATTALLLLSVGVGTFFLIHRQPSTTIAKTDKQPENDVESTPTPDPEPIIIANAPNQPSKDLLESQPQHRPTADGKKGEADTKKTEASGDGPPKDDGGERQQDTEQPNGPTDDDPPPVENKPPENPPTTKDSPPDKTPKDQAKPVESSDNSTDNRTNAATEDKEKAVNQTARAPENETSEPPKITLIKNGFKNGFFAPTEEQRTEEQIGTLRIKYPEDYIFIACSKTKTHSTLVDEQDEKKSILAFKSTPVVQSGPSNEYELLKKIKLELTDVREAKISINDEDNPRLTMTLTKEATWADLLSEWKKQNPSCFPRSRQDPSQDAITISEQSHPISPGNYFLQTAIEAKTMINSETDLKILISTKNPEKDVVTVLKTAVNKTIDYERLGIFNITKDKIEWSSGPDFNDVKKDHLKTLFFILTEKKALPCHYPRPEVITLRLKLLPQYIQGKLDELKNIKDKPQYFNLNIDLKNDNIDPIFENANSWKIDTKSVFEDRIEEGIDTNSNQKLKLAIIPSGAKDKCYLTVLVGNKEDKKVLQVQLEKIPVDDKEYQTALISSFNSFDVEGSILYDFQMKYQKAQIEISRFIIKKEGS